MVLAHLDPFVRRPEYRAERRPASPAPAARRDADVIPLRPKRTRAQLAQLDDAALLGEVLAAGGGAPFEVLFTRFRSLMLACIVRTARAQGRRLGDADAHDVLGDVSVALLAHDLRKLRQYRPERGTTVATWIGLVATSTCRDALRKHRRARLELTDGLELERLPSAAPAPDAALADAESRRVVEAMLAQFSERDRAFVMLYFAEALAPEAVAEEMGISVATVYSKKAKIKARLTSLAAVAMA
jgi:RNA polymerase sigma-70 factor (ECF subfamily)